MITLTVARKCYLTNDNTDLFDAFQRFVENCVRYTYYVIRQDRIFTGRHNRKFKESQN